jgi:methylenetetrahydrofolate dehydrogenase (NADP+)/methenyltetrahydrofolate cyclohydrolase
MILTSALLVDQLKASLIEGFGKLSAKLKIAIIYSDSPASKAYLQTRKALAKEFNIEVDEYNIINYSTDQKVEDLIQQLNADNEVQGIVIDRPLPQSINEVRLFSKITSSKDLEAVGYNAASNLYKGDIYYLTPTALAIVNLLTFHQIRYNDKKVLIVGKSITVGKSLATYFLSKNVTLMVAYDGTRNLRDLTKMADIIIVSTGQANTIDKNDVSPNAVIVDVGTNFINNKLVGDVNPNVAEVTQLVTPVPGGIGPLTNICLYLRLYFLLTKDRRLL